MTGQGKGLMPQTKAGQVSQRVPWMPILMYHRVVDRIEWPDPYHLCVTTEQFEAQMRFLRDRGYQSIYLNDLSDQADVAAPRGRKQVVITFDDGYKDTYTKAFPVLQKYGMSATVMLVSGHISGCNVWDKGKAPLVPLMGAAELREMASHGVRFGSHSVTHRPLTQLSSRDALKEIAESRAALEDLLGSEVTTFCFPYGRSTGVHREMAWEAGYKLACGIEEPDNSRFNLSRVDAARCGGSSLLWRLRVSGVYYRLRRNPGLRTLRKLSPVRV